MDIIKADKNSFELVKMITQTTIKEVYPKYYPMGAVEFFQKHHSDEHIVKDIEDGKVYLLLDNGENVGTVTVSGNEINRLFVLPNYQHKGYGRAMLDFAEKIVLETYPCVKMDASLPAKKIYKKRGYKEIEYNTVMTENGDYLCYDVMRLINNR